MKLNGHGVFKVPDHLREVCVKHGLDSETLPEFVNAPAVAELCGISTTTLSAWLDKDTFRHTTLPGGTQRVRRRVCTEDVLEFLASNSK